MFSLIDFDFLTYSLNFGLNGKLLQCIYNLLVFVLKFSNKDIIFKFSNKNVLELKKWIFF